MTREEYEKLENDALAIETEIKCYIVFFEEIGKRLFELRTFDAAKANELHTLINNSMYKYFQPMDFISWSDLYNKQLKLKKEFNDGRNNK